MKTVGQFQALFGNRDQHIGADRVPDLCLDCVLAGAKEGLDSKVLLDPFEEQLHLPPLSIEVGNHDGFERKIVGQTSDPFALVVFDDYPDAKRRDSLCWSSERSRRPPSVTIALNRQLVRRLQASSCAAAIRRCGCWDASAAA